MMTATNTRKEARESLAGKWGKGALITLVYAIFTSIISYIAKNFENNSMLNLIISIIVLIIDVPISFGFIISFIKLKRGEDVGAFDFFKDGFANFKRAWGITWNTFVKMIVPIILIIIAGMIFGFCGVASVNNIMSGSYENVSILLLLGMLLYIVAIVYAIVRGLLYSLSYYIAYDKTEISTKEAVNESAELMKGNRGNIFVLELSFIGWAILSVFTLGIGMLWLIPYMQVALVCFYEELINKNN